MRYICLDSLNYNLTTISNYIILNNTNSKSIKLRLLNYKDRSINWKNRSITYNNRIRV